jgi:hypothetical protein
VVVLSRDSRGRACAELRVEMWSLESQEVEPMRDSQWRQSREVAIVGTRERSRWNRRDDQNFRRENFREES